MHGNPQSKIGKPKWYNALPAGDPALMPATIDDTHGTRRAFARG